MAVRAMVTIASMVDDDGEQRERERERERASEKERDDDHTDGPPRRQGWVAELLQPPLRVLNDG